MRSSNLYRALLKPSYFWTSSITPSHLKSSPTMTPAAHPQRFWVRNGTKGTKGLTLNLINLQWTNLALPLFLGEKYPNTMKTTSGFFKPWVAQHNYQSIFFQKLFCNELTVCLVWFCSVLGFFLPFPNPPATSGSAAPFVFPICFCFSAPAPCWPLPLPFWIVALEELTTLCGDAGGLFSLLLAWPPACLSFSLFFRCSCILRLLSSRWMKFVLPWERGSTTKGELMPLFSIIY